VLVVSSGSGAGAAGADTILAEAFENDFAWEGGAITRGGTTVGWAPSAGFAGDFSELASVAWEGGAIMRGGTGIGWPIPASFAGDLSELDSVAVVALASALWASDGV